MPVRLAAASYACEYGDHRERWLHRLREGKPAEAACYVPASAVSPKARRQMSRSALLAVDAAERLEAPFDRRSTALFSACPTGHEVALPFVCAVSRALKSDADEMSLSERVFDQKAGGHVVDYLRYSAGTLPGHVAKHAGLRGDNACFAGRAASFFALRKAILAITSGRLEHVVVVGAESLDEAELSRGASDAWPRELGVAVLLTRADSSEGLQLGLVEGFGESTLEFRHFEAIGHLAGLAMTAERLGRGNGCFQVELSDQRLRSSARACGVS